MSKNDPHILGKESIGKLYTCFCRRFHARIYPARAERYERGYGNPVAHVNALYHQFFLFRNIVFYLPR